jgi:hypothetical protein
MIGARAVGAEGNRLLSGSQGIVVATLKQARIGGPATIRLTSPSLANEPLGRAGYLDGNRTEWMSP